MQMQRMSIIDDIKRFILALALAAIFSAPVGAATLTVTKTVDTGDGVCDTDCSLREAIWVASAGDTINFAPSLNSQTITLVNTIPLDKNLTIQGPGLSLLTILNNASYTIAFVTNGTGITVTFDGVTLRGTSTNGLLHNKSSDTVTFTNSVLSDCGKVDSGANGGAVWNEGTLTLASSTVSNNAANRAGAILNDGMLTITNSHLENNTANTNGAILNRSTLTIQDSILTGNQTSEYGGAIHNDGGSLTITDSTLSNNAAPFGGGILTGNDGTVTISNSTLSNNNATYDGGAILIFAGTVTVTNSTFSGNTANNGGGIANSGTLTVTNSTVSGNTAGIEGGGIASDGAITVRQSTFTGNSAAAGGGIASHTLTIGNSLIAGNTATTGREINVKVSWSSQGYNLIGFSSSTGMSGSGNPTLTATDFTPTVGLGQIIGALIDNGGPTQTHALVTGSPAINAGSDALATAAGLSTDQRGQPRFSGTVDIGSYEVQSAVVNGACGASAGQTFTSAPSSNLCTAGSPSSVTTNPGTFTWNCTGSGGGSTASCSATRAFTVTPSASTQGSINPNTAVTVAYNATRAFTVTPNTGYTASVSGCSGSLSGTTYTTGPITANCTVAANFVAQTYTVTATAGTGGTISPGSALVSYNQTTAFTVTPNTGYTASVSGCNGALTGTTYTTGPITANCAVTATFSPNNLTVTASAGANGAISPASRQVTSGATTTFTVTPNTGYTASVSGCSGALSGTTYTTGPITANCTVSATFALKTYTVATSAGANGSLTPTSRTVNHGATTTFTVTPNSGYTAAVTGCSGSLSGTTYTTGPITANCTVTATFSPKTTDFTVTTNAGANGAISPVSRQVAPGATTTFTVTPNTGYTATVAGCSGTLSGATYTTGPVNAPCLVVATFTPTLTATTPVLTTPVLPDAIVGVPYAAVLTAIGGQYPYAYTATNLPPGLALTTEGILHGALTTSGAFAVTVTVTDALGQHSARGYTVTASAGLALVTADLPDALVHESYTQTLAAVGGQPPYIFTATGLPAGFSLSPSGALRGTPVEGGHVAVQLTVTDALDQHATKDLVLTVRDLTFTEPSPEQPDENITGAAESCPAANITTRTLKLGDPGAPTTGPDGVTLLYGLLEITVTGCQPGQTVLAMTTVYPAPLPPDAQYWKYGRTRDNDEPHWYVLPGAIIQGNAITLIIVDGDIGDSDLAVDGNILDPGGPGITLNTIDGAVPAVLPISEPYRADFQVRCDQGRCPADSVYDWSVAAGALPDGLALISNGATATLSGTPTRAGRYPFTVQVLARGDSPTPTQQSYTVRITNGSPDPAATTLITHYYVSILEREPEADGLAFWQGLIAEREAQKIDIKPVFRDMANFFFNSPEYLGRNTTDRQFITNLYLTFFQREPDEGGYAFWLEQLANGMVRNTAMAGFLYSQEFTDFMEALGL